MSQEMPITHQLRRAGTLVYLATDESVAADLSRIMFAGAVELAAKDAEIERLRKLLGQACRQWRMYADLQEDRDIATEQSVEGVLYRKCADNQQSPPNGRTQDQIDADDNRAETIERDEFRD